MFKLDLERQRNQRSNCQHLLDHRKGKRIPEKHLLLLHLTILKPLTVWITTNCENSSRDGNTRPCDLPPEKSFSGQEATVRTGHGTIDWFQIGKGICQGCILSPCLFNLYAEYIMRNAGLEEAQAGVKIAGRNINDLRYADDTPLLRQKVKKN